MFTINALAVYIKLTGALRNMHCRSTIHSQHAAGHFETYLNLPVSTERKSGGHYCFQNVKLFDNNGDLSFRLHNSFRSV